MVVSLLFIHTSSFGHSNSRSDTKTHTHTHRVFSAYLKSDEVCLESTNIKNSRRQRLMNSEWICYGKNLQPSVDIVIQNTGLSLNIWARLWRP